ncbi:MAG TPA: hypothetical protein VF763_11115, partial [Candidatus Limnocylindrales bacterium]
VGPLRVDGLALAIGLGAWIEAVILLVLLRRRVESLELIGLTRSVLVFGAGAAVASLAALGVVRGAETLVLGPRPAALGSLVELALGGGVAAVAYAAWSVVFGVEELGQWSDLARDFLRRRA